MCFTFFIFTILVRFPTKIVKKINFSSFWLKTRFSGPWLHVRFFYDFGSKSGSGGGKASGKGKPPQNRKEIVKKRKFLVFLAKNDSIGTLVAFTFVLRFFLRFWYGSLPKS